MEGLVICSFGEGGARYLEEGGVMPTESLQRWVERVVVGLDLCPFAASPLAAGRVRFAVAHCEDVDAGVRAAAEECVRLVETPAAELSTTLLGLPGWPDFPEFLELVGSVEVFMEMAGLEGLIQVVAFHPDWVAEGEDPDDPASASNRSPVPALHFIREEEIERAVRGHPDVEGIVNRNAALLRAMGWEGLAKLRRVNSE